MKRTKRLEEWVVARKRHRLSHAHVQMARELGMNPRKLGSLDNHHQEPWKAPLPELIEHVYEKRFGRARPVVVLTIEQSAELQAAKQAGKKAAKAERRAAKAPEVPARAAPETSNDQPSGTPRDRTRSPLPLFAFTPPAGADADPD